MIVVHESWATVDRWWTDAPLRKSYAVLVEDGNETAPPICAVFDHQTGEWSLIGPEDGATTVIRKGSGEEVPWPGEA